MGYSILYFDAATARDAPARVYDAACEGIPAPAGKSARVAEFARRAVAAVPELLETESEDASSDPQGNYYLLQVYIGADWTLLDQVAQIAAECGLTAYDPQLEAVVEPQEWSPHAGRQLHVPVAAPPPVPDWELSGLHFLYFDAAAAVAPPEQVYEAVRRGNPASAGRSERVAEFAQRAVAALPELLETESRDASADPRGNYYLLQVPMGADADALSYIARIADECGLAVYDPRMRELAAVDAWLAPDSDPLPEPDLESRLVSRSYILLFFDPRAARTDGAGLLQHLCSDRIEAAGKSPAVAEFVEQAWRRCPELEDMGYEDLSSRWDRGNYFLVHLPYPDGGEYLPGLTRIAEELDLSAFDPQKDPRVRRLIHRWK